MEFKGTKGNIEIVEHSWSDTSLMIGDKQIAFKSIYDESTEENQDDLGREVMYNFLLLSKAPKMLEMLKYIVEESDRGQYLDNEDIFDIKQLIKQATEL